MKKSRFSEHQIITILKSVEAGRTAKDVCREHGISSATFYAWKSKFGGMEASDIKRMRDLEHENALLKQMYVDLSLENRPLKDVIEKSSEASREAWRRAVRSRRIWTFRQQDVHGIAHKLKRVSLQTNAAWRQPCDNDASWAGRTLPAIRICQIFCCAASRGIYMEP